MRSLLVVSALLCAVSAPAGAIYHPEHKVPLKGKMKTMLREVLVAMKSLPADAREAIVAGRLGLYFDPQTGESTYNPPDIEPNRGASFVGTDGELHSYYGVVGSVPPVQWRDVDSRVSELGASAVFPSIARDVTAQIYATARAIVQSMPPDLRDLWLSEEGGLLYTASGDRAYSGGYSNKRMEGGVEVQRRKLANYSDLRFRNSEGEEMAYSKVMMDNNQLWERRINILYLCIKYTSRKEIIGLFNNEISQLRKSADGSAKDSSGDTGEDKASAALREACSSLPREAREALLAEQLGLCFMEDGSASISKKRVRSGARFIGSDGKSYELASALSKASSADLSKARDAFRSASKSTMLSAFSDELGNMAQKMAPAILKGMPEMLRDAWLAEVAELCFTPGGGDAYTGKMSTARSEMGLEIKYKALDSKKALFVDSKGKEHKYSECDAAMGKWSKRWTLLYACAQLGGEDKILEALPVEVDALRRSHSKVTGAPYTPPANLAQKPAPAPATPAPSAELVLAKLPTTPPPCPAPSASDSSLVARLKNISSQAREAWFAHIFGICFMPDLSSAYDGMKVKGGARYVGSDGEEHDYWSAMIQAQNMWTQLIADARDNKVRLEAAQAFPELVTQMLRHTAQHHLKAMPELTREAWLAEISGLYFAPNVAQSAYSGGFDHTTMDGGFRVPYMNFRPGSSFRDSKGTVRGWTIRRFDWDKWVRYWNTLQLCAYMIGIEQTTSVVPELMATLRKNATEASKYPYKWVPPAIEKKPESADSKLAAAAEYIRNLPKSVRETWICEAMGACHMKDSSSVLSERRWIKKDASYVNSDAQERPFWEDQKNTLGAWGYLQTLLPNGKMDALPALTEETEALSMAAIKYHLLHLPQLMRDAWLCEFAGLCYVPGSSVDAYEPHEYKTENNNTNKTKWIKRSAAFTDTQGVQHLATERVSYWGSCGKVWDIMSVCVKYCDIRKVLGMFPQEVDTLRRNYEKATNRKAPDWSLPLPPNSPDSKTAMGKRS